MDRISPTCDRTERKSVPPEQKAWEANRNGGQVGPGGQEPGKAAEGLCPGLLVRWEPMKAHSSRAVWPALRPGRMAVAARWRQGWRQESRAHSRGVSVARPTELQCHM